MKKKIEGPGTVTPPIARDDTLGPLVGEIRALIQSARRTAASTVNSLQVATNFEIGRRIVEEEQRREARAEYGSELINALSVRLSEEFGAGFSARNLRNFRAFYLTYRDRGNAIWQKHSAKSIQDRIELPAVFTNPFPLSWSHYVLLLSIKDLDERSFYEIEAGRESWSIPELKRQVASVELTLPPDANINAKEYQLYLPSKELFRQKLLEWTAREEGEA